MFYKICPVCDKDFESDDRRQIYCSKKCKRKSLDNKRKKDRMYGKKCKYCGKTFMGNRKTVYCSDECAKKSKQDFDREYAYHRYYSDIEYRRENREKSTGTFDMQSNLDEEGNRDWEKEYKMILALKKQAGLK